ncbi:MAG: AbiU2 domain-containing protein [Halobacteriota archaeon]
MSFDPSTYIDELRQATVAADLNYQIWWAYKSPDTRPRFIDTLNGYPLFFQTSIHAHFVALLVALYRLYETRHDTFNIPNLLRSLRAQALLPDSTIDEIELLQKNLKPLWLKVKLLRNEAFAHRTRALSFDEIFKKAKATPNDLRDLIEKTKHLINRVTRALDNSSHSFNLDASSDLLRLLQDLSKLDGTRSYGG